MSASTLTESAPLRSDARVISLVGLVHASSHFSQLVLPPLLPWLHGEFGIGYAALGSVLTVFFVVSCVVQALSGFVVDRHGARPVLYGGMALMALGIVGFALAQSFWMLVAAAIVTGMGNGVFHPADFTLLNRKVSPARLGHAYSVHGITGSLGWAAAPALVVPLAQLWGWRLALLAAAGVVVAILLVACRGRGVLADELAEAPARAPAASALAAAEAPLAFLRLPAVWVCMGFFFLYAVVLSVVQTFAAPAAERLHAMPQTWLGLCVTLYMVALAVGMVAGGFLVQRDWPAERIVGTGFGVAAMFAVAMALAPLPAASVPLVFVLMGLVSGLAGPSRDMLVKQSTPLHASGRVYGVVYAGLDIGQALAPLVFGWVMDHGHHQVIWLGLAAVQLSLIGSAAAVAGLRRVPQA
ncbi:MFS transporter [Corticibacter populi]|uniref:MFS transporter n=1 Tax=Corticibacter populi TaxID=1550736 RepID=A0A3M6QTA1_9BURK|nr:MFS transporter [Corticibacter populi]RMX05789.1 MFS transporter [Corticibacter populi]RZS30901.1 putative MFS family arabinose efflux permease [Corticibacter populi]